MTISVIIVNYNTRDLLLRCMTTLTAALAEIDAEVIVVDNDSDDGSATAVKEEFPKAQLIGAGANLGFARANNLAAASARGDWLLFLNPDTEVNGNAIRRLLAYAAGRPNLGAVGCRVRLTDSSIQDDTCGRFFTFREWLLTRAGFRLLFPGRTIFAGRALASSGPVDWVSGVCMLVPAGPFQQISGFCEAMFAYMEDMDLCLRLKQRGLSSHYFVDAEITHVRGGAFSPATGDRRPATDGRRTTDDGRRTILQERSYVESELLYVRRNWPFAARAAYEGFVMVRELLKLLAATLVGNRYVASRSRWLLGRLFAPARCEEVGVERDSR
jgi:GT2 family glycosyltransferase